jgi:hypothetical protein
MGNHDTKATLNTRHKTKKKIKHHRKQKREAPPPPKGSEPRCQRSVNSTCVLIDVHHVTHIQVR